MPIPNHNEWLNNTNAGVFSRRNASLRALDEAIRLQREDAVKAALINYLAEGDADFHLRAALAGDAGQALHPGAAQAQ